MSLTDAFMDLKCWNFSVWVHLIRCKKNKKIFSICKNKSKQLRNILFVFSNFCLVELKMTEVSEWPHWAASPSPCLQSRQRSLPVWHRHILLITAFLPSFPLSPRRGSRCIISAEEWQANGQVPPSLSSSRFTLWRKRRSVRVVSVSHNRQSRIVGKLLQFVDPKDPQSEVYQ